MKVLLNFFSFFNSQHAIHFNATVDVQAVWLGGGGVIWSFFYHCSLCLSFFQFTIDFIHKAIFFGLTHMSLNIHTQAYSLRTITAELLIS